MGTNGFWSKFVVVPTFRCGLCYCDLGIKLTFTKPISISQASYYIDTTGHVGAMLEELLAMGYGDVYEEMNANDRKLLDKRDKVIVQHWLNTLKDTVCLIDPDINEI